MEDGSQTEVSTVKQTALGGMEFQGSIEQKDPLAAPTTPAPDGIPEKFWDPVAGKLRTDDLIKSYQSLEAKLGQPKADDGEVVEEKPEGETEEKPEGETEEKPEGETEEAPEVTEELAEQTKTPEFETAMEAAQKAYAETGELAEEQRQPFLDMGFTNQHIDFYLNGVKATEAALYHAAHQAAGGEDAYKAAITWAAKGLSEKQIVAFNAQVADVETVGPAVAGLMALYRKANPGEGQLTNINSGVNRGDVYESMAEFQQDLTAADKVRDPVARKKAVDKLRRSREAGTIKHSNRRQPFGG